jgi:hypothetical protein
MEIIDWENNNINISFHAKNRMGHFCSFNSKICLQCDTYKNYNLMVYPKDNLHKDIMDIIGYPKHIEVDELYFNNIFDIIKNINYDVFIQEIEITDIHYIIAEIKKGNYSIKVKYFPFVIHEPRCKEYYSIETIENINKLNNVYEELKRKIKFEDWYLHILRKHNLELILPN